MLFPRLREMRRRERYILAGLTVVIIMLAASVGCEAADAGIPRSCGSG